MMMIIVVRHCITLRIIVIVVIITISVIIVISARCDRGGAVCSWCGSVCPRSNSRRLRGRIMYVVIRFLVVVIGVVAGVVIS